MEAAYDFRLDRSWLDDWRALLLQSAPVQLFASN